MGPANMEKQAFIFFLSIFFFWKYETCDEIQFYLKNYSFCWFGFFWKIFFAVSPTAHKVHECRKQKILSMMIWLVSPGWACGLLSELSKSPHRLVHWLCVCQPTCPDVLLPPPLASFFTLHPPLLLPLFKASLITHGPAPAHWSLSLMSFVAGWSE